MNHLMAQLTHRPFLQLSELLHAAVGDIALEWERAARESMPQMGRLTFDELMDSTPAILHFIADALGSDDPERIGELMCQAPARGLSRLRLNFDVVEVMQEDRLLRAILVQHLDTRLGRPMLAIESAALHAAIDLMLQRSVVALVDEQKSQVRAAAERELKFLSFLSHDLNNNLNSVMMTLHALEFDLKEADGFGEVKQSLTTAQQCIHDTVTGMRRMLVHERHQKTVAQTKLSPVDLHTAATNVVAQFSRAAAAKGIGLTISIPPRTVIESDGELLSLILQNLVGNSVKYSSGGEVCVGFDSGAMADRSSLWVSDGGPGIAPEMLQYIFGAFARGLRHGQPGSGLGLAIASQAAKLLDGELTVESEIGVGSTFRLTVPSRSAASGKVDAGFASAFG